MNGLQTTFLDLTRTIASQLVVIGHIYVAIGGVLPVEIGNFGVLLFFVLSGYLICFTIMRRRSMDRDYTFYSFFLDRLFRIFTPLVPALLLVLAVDYIAQRFGTGYAYGEYFTVRDFFGNLFMLSQNPIGLIADKGLNMPELKIATFGSARPHWTVIIEWWIYMFFGWLVLKSTWLKTKPVRFFLVLSVFAIVPAFNIVAGTGEGLTVIWFAAALAAWAWNSADAKLPSYVENLREQGSAGLIVVWGSLLLLALMLVRMVWVSFIQTDFVWESYPFYDVSFGLMLLCAFLLVFWYFDGVKTNMKRNSIIRAASDYSYSLYLIHYSLIMCFVSLGYTPGSPLVTGIVYFIICQIVSIVFWWLFERHYRTLKNLWIQRTNA